MVVLFFISLFLLRNMNERFDYNKEREKTLIKNICLDIYTTKKIYIANK